MKAQERVRDRKTIGSIRDDFPMLAQCTYFNCGGIARLSKSVGAELLRVPQAIIEEGPWRMLSRDDSFLGLERARGTLAAFIGAGGLGDPIVTGLTVTDTNLVLSGALPAAALAIAVDAGLAGVERVATPRGLRL